MNRLSTMRTSRRASLDPSSLRSLRCGRRRRSARGYAIDRAEPAPGSCCVAAPIFNANNRPIGAIGVSGRELEALIRHHDLVRQTAEVIFHRLL